ncbi:MAG: monomeric [FeFe] hydrogenase, partial [Oscillospiraceae bacterium]
MRGIHTYVNDLRRKVFTEVARLGYEGGDYRKIAELPYKIVPGEIAEHRENIFLERAIVSERVRLAMGLPLRSITEHQPLIDEMSGAKLSKGRFDLPLVNIISYACNACPPKQIYVTDACQGCLAHPCREVCPRDAISFVKGKSVIDQDKCIKCQKCIDQCSYNAIIKLERPCAEACKMDAIESDELGRAKINYDKCVSCGMCLVNCPFSAIVDKSQIYGLIQNIKNGEEVTAAIAPSFIGQFGENATPGKIITALKKLGFADVFDVSIGADLCTIEEAFDFIEKVPSQQPFMATSCCPAWSMMAKKLYPEFASYISMAMTPMVLTAKLIKKDFPNRKVCFIGPCAAKKCEGMEPVAAENVDFVLTFEELQGMFDAKDI